MVSTSESMSRISANRFDLASQAVLDHLKATLPLGFWSVTRYDGSSQVYLTTRDDAYGLGTGDGVVWSESLCQHAVSGAAPEIAPDAMAVPAYAASPAAVTLPIGAYVGVPIRHRDGSLFGTLCGLDPAPQPAAFAEHAPLLRLLSGLLSQVLEADLELTDAARTVELAELRAETDPMTGLLNRRGWERYLRLEDERYRRYGDPCSVLILDLDGLKNVNDTLGHAAGDELIRRAAEVIRTCTRAGDVTARLGGDEFGVVVPRADVEVAAALHERLQGEFDAAGIGCSIGRSALSIKTGLDAACADADAAMYATKARRRLDLVS